MFTVEANFLKHDGGTKFYETIAIHSDGGSSLLIKRWGASAKQNGGGQLKYERGSKSVVNQENLKILDEKRRGKVGQGRYVDTPVMHGLNASKGTAFDSANLLDRVQRHYSDGSDVALEVARYFSIDVDLPAVDNDPSDIVTLGEEPEAKPEINRGAEWASW